MIIIFIERIIRRREDNIKSDLKVRGKEGMNSIHLDQDRSKNQTVANTVRIFSFGKFLDPLRTCPYEGHGSVKLFGWLFSCYCENHSETRKYSVNKLRISSKL